MNGSRPGANPFVGPRPLEPGEPIYGRSREINELYFRLNAERIVLLHSPSGAGKSSLVQAGLLPLLNRSFDVWGPTRVNAEPTAAGTNRYLLSALQGFEEGVPESLRRPAEVLAGQTLPGYFKQRPRRRSAPQNVVLVFDQLEEILTVDPLAAAAKHEFFAQLGDLLRNPRVWALFALREDYLAPLDPYAPQVPTQLKNRFRIDLLGLTAAREAIVGLAPEFPRVDELIKDLATVQVQQPDGTFLKEPGPYVEPVQLQVVCRRLWETGDLSASGGSVNEALADYYASSVAEIAGGDLGRERAIRDWFGKKLITAGGIRGQVLREAGSSGGLANDLIGPLRDTHLVRAEQRAGKTWYELAHDRLIEPVRNDNAAWEEEHLEKAQRQAALWEQQGEPPGLLLAGAELAEASAWEEKNTAQVTETERRFLAESREMQEQADRERQQAKRIRWLATGATLTSILALLALVWALVSYNTVKQEARRSASRELALQSSQLLDEQLDLAVLLAQEAGRVSPTIEARSSLFAALQHNPRLWRFLPSDSDKRRRVAFQPGGPVLAAAGESDVIELWNAATGRRLPGAPLYLEGAAEVRTLAFSPDGRWLAAGGKREDNVGLLTLWDLSVTPPRRHGRPLLETVVRSLAFCGRAEGTRLVWITKDELLLWPLDGNRKLLLMRKDPRSRFSSLAMTPDCARLAVGHEWDTGIDLWTFTSPYRATGPQVLWTQEAPAAPVPGGPGIKSLAFGPAGQRLAVAPTAGDVFLWDLRTEQSETLYGTGKPVGSLAFRPDARALAGAGGGAGVFLWDLETGGREVLAGLNAPVTGVAFNRKGDVLASADEDGKLILWKPAVTQRLGRFLEGHANPVWAVSFSRDSRFLISAEGWNEDGLEQAQPSGESGTVRLWDLRTGEGTVLPGNPGPSRAVAFSPDGGMAVAGSRGAGGGSLHLWRLAEGKAAVEAMRWKTPEPVNAVAFGPGGKSFFHAEGKDLRQRLFSLKPPQLRTTATHSGNIWSLLFRHGGASLLASDETGKVYDWDPVTGGSKALLEPFPPSPQVLAAVAESPDGHFVAAASWVGGTHCVYLWEMPSGSFLDCLEGHQESVSAVAFTQEGSLVSADDGGQLIFWDPETRKKIGQLRHGPTVNGLAASPDGRSLASASGDHTVLLLDLDWDTAARNLAGAGRKLTEEECKAWIHFEPTPPSCAQER